MIRQRLFLGLTLSGAHFSGASTPDMIVTIRVFGIADYESEVRFSKFKIPIWRSKLSKKGKLMLNFGFKGFFNPLPSGDPGKKECDLEICS